MNTLTVYAWGKETCLNTRIDNYRNNGNLYIGLIDNDGLPYADLTVNIETLPDDHAAVDTNNCPWAEDLILENKLGERTGYSLGSGFCRYPVYKFDLNKVREYER